MEPTIKPGDRVRIEAPARVRTGDIVLLEGSCGYILHRVVLRVPGTGWLLHLGDADSALQPGLTRASRIVGACAMGRRRPAARDLAASVATIASALGNRLRAGLETRLRPSQR